VLNAFKNTAAAQASGLRLAGQKYFVLQVTDRSIYGKKQVCLNPLLMSAIGADGARRRTAWSSCRRSRRCSCASTSRRRRRPRRRP
jgi:hypothetical protein